MEKKKISVHAFTIHIYTIAIVLLILLCLVLGLKYLHLKLAVHHFTASEMWQQMNQQPMGSISDYGRIIATSIGQYPQDKPLYQQGTALQSYVTALSSEMKRDLVVVDAKQLTLADTIVTNVGSKYSFDSKDEVGQTLADGQTRTFTQMSKDYPSGLSEVVVPVKDAKGQIVGAVIISNTQIGK